MSSRNGILSSLEALSQKFPSGPSATNPSHPRVGALKKYFARGGVISVSQNSANGNWPKLLYPNPVRLEMQIKEFQEKRKIFEGRKKEWNSKLSEAKHYKIKNEIKKFGDSLYWKHMVKMLSDKDYREDFAAVKMPSHLIADEKFRGVVNKFVNDIDYRKQLSETVQHSLVYKNGKGIGNYSNELKKFREGMSSQNIQDIDKKINELNELIAVFEEIKKWSQET